MCVCLEKDNKRRKEEKRNDCFSTQLSTVVLNESEAGFGLICPKRVKK